MEKTQYSIIEREREKERVSQTGYWVNKGVELDTDNFVSSLADFKGSI